MARRDPGEILNSIEDAVRRAGSRATQARSEELVEALIESGELAQGLADAEFEASGEDEATQLQSAALALACAISRRLLDIEEPGGIDGVKSTVDALRSMAPRDAVLCRQPEGYAHYAVYPQAYAAAARRGDWPTPPLVIGLRSIGASLAAVVAVATRAAGVLTLRPVGPPFRREIRASRTLRARLAAHEGPFAIVDEGPGLSGSSFAAVAQLLESLGISSERMVFMPSHGGEPGGEACQAVVRRWRRSVRLVASSEDILSFNEVGRLFADLIGTPGCIRDISGGKWRADLLPGRRPPAWPAQERLKLRLGTGEGEFVARFAGLGRLGAEKFARARMMFAAGFVPEPLALRRGLLLERWVEGRPVAGEPSDALITHLARYIGLRGRCFPAQPGLGADRAALVEMAMVNSEALGGASLRTRVAGELDALDREAVPPRPIYTDGRLHPWEWLWSAEGRLVKTDAVDHACGHDLIGAQDVAWDVAGAVTEFKLSGAQTRRLREQVQHESGLPVPLSRLHAFCLFYSIFQAGLWDMAMAGTDPLTAAEAAARKAFYLEALTTRLAPPSPPAADTGP
jgi:hypothetical protein